MPNDIRIVLFILLLGAVFFAVLGIQIVRKRKCMTLEVMIALLALCVFGVVGMLYVSFCIAAVFLRTGT